jgi:hypothetical protein
MRGVEKPRNPGMLLSPGDLSHTSILYLVIPIVLISQRCISYLFRVRMNYMISIISHATTFYIYRNARNLRNNMLHLDLMLTT